MSDGRKVICQWCGKEMRLWEDGNMAWFECMDCGAQTPAAFSDADDAPTDVMREAAYLAATRRPENRPLDPGTFLSNMDDADAIWIVEKDGTIRVAAAGDWKPFLEEFQIPGSELWFARKPTPEDIEVARAAKGEQT